MRGTLEERFWAKVDKRGPDECWPWLGASDARHQSRRGYGKIRIQTKVYRASHLALEIAGRPVPAGMLALHRCDYPPCSNEKHLFCGTNADNSADMVAKGRAREARGVKNSFAKLGEADVRCIRRSLANGIKPKELARLFGVSTATVSMIKRRQRWGHLA